MSSSNYCLLTCIQISQEAGQVVWYSHLFQNFPMFIVMHPVKGFGIVNKAEIDVFLELVCFFDDPADVGNLISGSSAFKVVLVIKNLPANAGDLGSIFGSGRFSEGEHGNLLQYSCWRTLWTEEPGRLRSMVSHRVGHNWSDLAHRDACTVCCY